MDGTAGFYEPGMKKLQINRPSAADIASLYAPLTMDSNARFTGNSRLEAQRDRRADLSRQMSSRYSNSQSQHSYSQGFSQSQPLSSRSAVVAPSATAHKLLQQASFAGQSQTSEELEQRLGSVENTLTGISESIELTRKELENVKTFVLEACTEADGSRQRLIMQQSVLQSVLKEDEAAIKRLHEEIQSLPNKMISTMETKIEEIRSSLTKPIAELLTSFKSDITALIPRHQEKRDDDEGWIRKRSSMQSSAPLPAKRGTASSQHQCINIESDPDDVVFLDSVHIEKKKVQYDDPYKCEEADLLKARSKLTKARRQCNNKQQKRS